MGKVRIVSYSQEPFGDRQEAGRLLSSEIKNLKIARPVVLGIPRGGLVVAEVIAKSLGADLDVVLSRKLGAPNNPELAIGALGENGKVFLNDLLISEIAVDREYIEQEKQYQWLEIKRRVELYRKVKPKVTLRERAVVLVDDGIATGATMQAALWSVLQEEPRKLIIALPVGSKEVIMRLAKEVDELICLRVPANLAAISQFYKRFGQVTDEEVTQILTQE